MRMDSAVMFTNYPPCVVLMISGISSTRTSMPTSRDMASAPVGGIRQGVRRSLESYDITLEVKQLFRFIHFSKYILCGL